MFNFEIENARTFSAVEKLCSLLLEAQLEMTILPGVEKITLKRLLLVGPPSLEGTTQK